MPMRRRCRCSSPATANAPRVPVELQSERIRGDQRRWSTTLPKPARASTPVRSSAAWRASSCATTTPATKRCSAQRRDRDAAAWRTPAASSIDLYVNNSSELAGEALETLRSALRHRARSAAARCRHSRRQIRASSSQADRRCVARLDGAPPLNQVPDGSAIAKAHRLQLDALGGSDALPG